MAMRFLQQLDPDLQKSLLAQLRNFWTHTSTAIEGNTLTLGETAFVLEYGLTVSGKSLKDHEEVVGHARAIELLYQFLDKKTIVQKDLFCLHQAVQTSMNHDVYHPVGGWKVERNGTHLLSPQGKSFLEYAAPEHVEVLMKSWLRVLNQKVKEFCSVKSLSEVIQKAVLQSYVELHVSFVRIHPFADGNGRIARLLANLPVLKAGYPPVLISNQHRQTYIQLLSDYEIAVGPILPDQSLLPEKQCLKPFFEFCELIWKETLEIVAEAHRVQEVRGMGV